MDIQYTFVRKSWLSTLAVIPLALCVLCGCGGGAGGAGNPPPPAVATLLTFGDKQHTFAGGNLMWPIAVHAQDASHTPISSLQITFSAPSGVTVFPPQVTTGPGGDAQALVNLPDTPFSQFTITASTSKGTAKFTEFTGPRLLQVFGYATAADAAVFKDGTIVAEGSGTGVVFTPDGSLQQYLGSNRKGIGLPDFISTGWGKSGTVGPDHRAYLYNSYYDAMFVLDDQMNVVRYIDFGSNSLIGPVGFDCYFAIAPSGNIFCDGNPVWVFDQNGSFLKNVPVENGVITLHRGIVASNSGNILVLFPDVGQGSHVNEYDLSGNVVHGLLLPADGRGLARDSAGNYAVLECCNPSSTVEFYDETYSLLKTTTLDVSGNFGGDQFFVDDAWNSYVDIGGRIYKYDSSGSLVWYTPGGPFTPPPAFINCGGGSAMAVDPSSGNVYMESEGFPGHVVVCSRSGAYQGQFTLPFTSNVGHGMAIDASSELYAVAGSTILVSDTSGNVLKSLSYPQIQNPTAITIASDNTKFVFDNGLGEIHEVDSVDHYVGSFAVNLPSGATLVQGEVTAAHDGNLVIGISVSNPPGSSNFDTYIKKVTREGAEIWSVGSSETDSPLQNLAVDTAGRVYLLRARRLEILDPNGTLNGQVDLSVNGGYVAPAAMTSVGDSIYFSPLDKIFVVSP